jgi:electron transfer flavoprotein alpha subunit
MRILVVAEYDAKGIKKSTLHTLTAAQEIAAAQQGEIDVLIVGHDCKRIAESVRVAFVKKALVADQAEYAHCLAENVAELIAAVAKQYTYVLAPASTFGKNLLPRVAALLDVGMLSDVIKVVTPDTFMRPIYAGNAIATVKSLDNIKLMTIRSTAFVAAKNDGAAVAIEAVNDKFANHLSSFVKEEIQQSARPELTEARIIISGGRGLKSAENFKLLESLADKLGAAIGASRAAVDAGFAPNDYQVGQTGKVVAPDLYMAIGISGAIQHLAGMKDSKVIVAINNDPDAPIFQIADYGLVADLFTSLQELQAELEK